MLSLFALSISRNLQLKWTLPLVLAVMLVLGVYGLYDAQSRRAQEEGLLLEKGEILARAGARAVGTLFEEALASGQLTHDQLFDAQYQPIAGTNPPKFHTAFDAYTDRVLQKLEDEMLQDGDVVFAAAADRNGYIPTHNSVYGVAAPSPDLNRSKRRFDDPVGIASARNTTPFQRQVYQRDTGETLWDLSSPILVNGEHWGAFRLGFSIRKTEARLAAVTWAMIASYGAIILLLAALSAWVLSRIGRPLKRAAAVALRLSHGDLRQQFTFNSADEIGQLSQAFAEMIAYQREMAEVAADVAHGDLTHSLSPKSDDDALGTAIQTMIVNLRALIGETTAVADAVHERSAFLGRAAGETASVVQQVTVAVQSVAVGSSEASSGAQATDEAVERLGQVIEGVARSATDQARQVHGVSQTASLMAEGVESVATNAQSVAVSAQQAHASAEDGAQAVRQTVAEMGEITRVVHEASARVQDLGKLGERIGAVVETIDDIAEQTNLLALNAAIEAARAGEHGAGFAVVADEVRKLAERSQRETRSIAALIREVQVATAQAVSAMDAGSSRVTLGAARADEAGRALSEILVAVDATAVQMQQIVSAAQAMAVDARGVVTSMHSISDAVKENSAATEEMAAQADRVAISVRTISHVATDSTAATEQVSASAEEMSAQVQEMSASAQDLAQVAERLSALVGQFHLEPSTEDRPSLISLHGSAAAPQSIRRSV